MHANLKRAAEKTAMGIFPPLSQLSVSPSSFQHLVQLPIVRRVAQPHCNWRQAGSSHTVPPLLLGEWQNMLVSDEPTLELAIKWCRGVGGWAGATIGNWQEERRRRRAILIPQLRSVSRPFSSSSLSLSSLLFDGNDDRT